MTAAASSIFVSEELIRRFDTSGPRYTSYPTADRFHGDFDARAYVRQLELRKQYSAEAPLSVYVHLPFCASLCYYCACNKVITKDRSQSVKYLAYLEKEMELVSAHLDSDRHTVQLHLGGGTPTFLDDAELHKLMLLLRTYFDFSDDAELSIEIDPRTVTPDTMAFLAQLGFNRTSLGVQDFDPAVQQAVHRIQPLAMVETAMASTRSAGFDSVNFDLIYGLPRQTLASFGNTLDQVVRLSPDRIALYNYAHLPMRFSAQRRIVEAELPSAEERLKIFMLSTQRLLDAGYVYIGLDHFAKPGDELARARLDHSLHRNFQGYTTRAACDLIGLGLSSIGKVGNAYSQAARTLDAYYSELDAGCLPIEKGFVLAPDDIVRRAVIMDLMCSGPLDFTAVGQQYGIDFCKYFAKELAELQHYESAGLIEIGRSQLTVTPRGRLFVRAIGMVFDKYLAEPSAARYSNLI